MGTLKIKDIEGEPQDIQKLFHEEGCDLSSYIGVEKTSGRIANKWIFVIAFSCFVLCSCIWTDVFRGAWNKVAILAALLLEFFFVGLIHYNFKNWMLTIISAVFGLTILSVALGIYTPQEAVRRIEQITTTQLGEKVK